MTRILILDNYDSFTHSFVHLLRAQGASCQLLPNDSAILGRAFESGQPLELLRSFEGLAGLVISAGPGRPADAGWSPRVLALLAGRLPILGMCLGHQMIAEHFGGRVVRAIAPKHGKATQIRHSGKGVLRGLPQGFAAAQYNSLVVTPQDLPECLEISAETEEGEIMALLHRTLPIEGVQFHPESILSSHGPQLVKNWLESL